MQSEPQGALYRLQNGVASASVGQAPHPESRWGALFEDALIERHLDRLEAHQQADGGWDLTWEPPSRAATLAYRGMETLRALSVLTAYGRAG